MTRPTNLLSATAPTPRVTASESAHGVIFTASTRARVVVGLEGRELVVKLRGA